MANDRTLPTLEYAGQRRPAPSSHSVALAFVVGDVAGALFGDFGFHCVSARDPDGVLFLVALLLAAVAIPTFVAGALYRARQGDRPGRGSVRIAAAVGVAYGIAPSICWLLPVSFPAFAVIVGALGVPILLPALLLRPPRALRSGWSNLGQR